MTLLKAKNLSKSYNSNYVLKNVNISLGKGEIIGLAGPNGAGKTTLIDVLSGFEPKDSGQILFKEEDITDLSQQEIANKGLVRSFQEKRLFDGMSVEENLLSGAQTPRNETLYRNLFNKTSDRTIKREIRKLTKKLKLKEVSDNYAGNISGGQKRITELGRISAFEADLILLDEPFSGVDPNIMSQITKIIQDLRDSNVSFLIAEHNLKLLEKVSDSIKILHNRNFIAEGDLNQLKKDRQVIRAYLGESS